MRVYVTLSHSKIDKNERARKLYTHVPTSFHHDTVTRDDDTHGVTITWRHLLLF